MSEKPVLFSWRQAVMESDLPPPSRHLLLTLATYMDARGEGCFPSVERLSRDTGMSQRTVHRHLRLVRDLGWLEVRKHGYAGRRWARNDYTLRWPPGAGGGPGGTDSLSAPPPEGTAPVSSGVVSERHTNTPLNTPDTPAGRAPELTEMPDDWQPPESVLTRCRIAGCRPVTADDVEMFRAHYIDRPMTDRQREGKFRQWMLREKKYDAERSQRSRQGQAETRDDRLARLAAKIGD